MHRLPKGKSVDLELKVPRAKRGSRIVFDHRFIVSGSPPKARPQAVTLCADWPAGKGRAR